MREGAVATDRLPTKRFDQLEVYRNKSQIQNPELQSLLADLELLRNRLQWHTGVTRECSLAADLSQDERFRHQQFCGELIRFDLAAVGTRRGGSISHEDAEPPVHMYLAGKGLPMQDKVPEFVGDREAPAIHVMPRVNPDNGSLPVDVDQT